MHIPDPMGIAGIKDTQLIEPGWNGGKKVPFFMGFSTLHLRKVSKEFWLCDQRFSTDKGPPIPISKGVNKAEGSMGYIRVKSLVAVIGVGTKPGVRDHLAAQVSPAPMEEGL